MICKCGKDTKSTIIKECEKCFDKRIEKLEPLIIADKNGRMMFNPSK